MWLSYEATCVQTGSKNVVTCGWNKALYEVTCAQKGSKGIITAQPAERGLVFLQSLLDLL